MAADIRQLLDIMARLRNPDGGCPWDVEQTFATIAPYTIEEAYEVADAIERDDLDGLRDELGDLLLQVVFHARMAEERGTFAFADVVVAICDKLVRRHPHVVADASVETAAAQTLAWEEHKDAERRAKAGTSLSEAVTSALDGVPVALPSLMRAAKIQKRASRVGFDWPDARAAMEKLWEETGELADELDGGGAPERIEDEMGDLLFSCVNVARKLDLDPEATLRRATIKFERRFRRLERMLAEDSGRTPSDLTLEELEDLWVRAKAAE